MEALQQYEDLLLLQKKFLPFTAGQIPKTCEEIVIICNILGMIYLKNGTNFFVGELVLRTYAHIREFPDVTRSFEKG